MKNKNNSSDGTVAVDDVKEQGSKFNLSKFEYDLYHEELDIAEKVIRVKRIALPKGEKWKIFEILGKENKLIFTVEGIKLSNKEKEYLRSVEGFNFLVAQSKLGISSFNALRKELKKQLK